MTACGNVQKSGDVSIVALSPESLAQPLAVEQTARELYAVVEQNRATKVLIDFEDVDFLSSRALGMMLTLRLKAAKAGAELVLANVRTRFGEILRLTNLDKLFTIFDSRQAALMHLQRV